LVVGKYLRVWAIEFDQKHAVSISNRQVGLYQFILGHYVGTTATAKDQALHRFYHPFPGVLPAGAVENSCLGHFLFEKAHRNTVLFRGKLHTVYGVEPLPELAALDLKEWAEATWKEENAKLDGDAPQVL
jgi:hypothetical protein